MTKITHFITRNFIIFSCWFLPNVVTAQLDSTTASISLVENYYQLSDSLDERDMAVLVLTFDDILDLGNIEVYVKLEEFNSLIYEVHYSREDLNTNGFLFLDNVQIPLFIPEIGMNYTIEILPRNQQGAYTQPISHNFSY